ncbi:SLAP domain-containing protein [Lactobacillus amylovorus]|uniref:SLAP domain-containing protein n=1 Tax=Lactobacillus amylovorus TaxID=1604 RepID=UPI00232DF0D4|nr:SLAP domain-containing protein [Lactobacillus amylovorus]MDB6234810.1 SLAP domain-containing protein [Lactobacillus amylovorus]
MKKNKFILASVATLMAVSPMLSFSSNTHTAQAATNSVRKTIMHTAVGYDPDGGNTGIKLYPYKTVNVDATPVLIKGQKYYKVTGKYLYIKPTNIDGVTRKVTRNTYIYKSSTGRTSFNGKWKLYKGETVTTYGGSYKFKNGKRYFRIGGPQKQYVKASNLGPVDGSNTPQASGKATVNYVKETTITVHSRSSYRKSAPIFTIDANNNATFVRRVPNGTKFTADRFEYGDRADAVADKIGSFNGNQAIYHIKGTNYWIYSIDVDAAGLMQEQLHKSN